jgi:hypothetical protein
VTRLRPVGGRHRRHGFGSPNDRGEKPAVLAGWIGQGIGVVYAHLTLGSEGTALDLKATEPTSVGAMRDRPSLYAEPNDQLALREWNTG